MNCAYHPHREAIQACAGCAKPLCADCIDAAGRCTVCAAKTAAEELTQADCERAEALKARDARNKRMAQFHAAALWALLCLCAAAVVWQMPAAVGSFKTDKPLRIGSYGTDAAADACITNLWALSRMLQEGKFPDASFVCPVSRLPYVARQTPGGMVYHCPKPENHGLRDLKVSGRHPVPEALK